MTVRNLQTLCARDAKTAKGMRRRRPALVPSIPGAANRASRLRSIRKSASDDGLAGKLSKAARRPRSEQTVSYQTALRVRCEVGHTGGRKATDRTSRGHADASGSDEVMMPK